MIKEEIVIEVTDNGMKEATQQANALASATKKVSDTSKEMGKEMQGTSQSVLDNGGAMGLLNDVTGGYAMMVKDAVEASVLFTKSQRLATIQQKIMTFAVGTTTGGMKAFRLALISTGIGAIVVALGLLIANFDSVKKAVLKLIPGLSLIGDAFSMIIDAVTDFIGVTSDATRALDKMVADSEASLKRNEHFLEANGDKFDEYTQRKIKANIDYNKKVKELAEDETLTDQEKLKRIQDFRDKADREILKADADRQEKLQKGREEEAKRIEEQNKKIAEERKKRIEEQRKLEEAEAERRRKIRETANASEVANEENRINTEVQNELKKEEILKGLREQTAEERLAEEEENNQKLLELAGASQEELSELQAFYINKRLEMDSDAKDKEAEKAKELADKQKELDQSVSNAKVNIASQTLELINQIAGEGSEIGKGIAVAQATISGIQGAQNAFTTAAASPIATVFPAYPFIQAGLAGAFSILQIKKILSTKPVEKGAPSNIGGGGGGSAPSAPSFNLVQGTGANQIAQSIGGQQQPLQAFVVSSNVTTAQNMDRNIVENSTL